MRELGRPSWQIQVDERQVLAVALYVRDVVGIAHTAAPVGLPELAPSVRTGGTVLASPEAGADWNAWWARALTMGARAGLDLQPPHFPAFANAPALQALLQEHFDAAQRWASDRTRSSVRASSTDLPLGDTMSEIEDRLGRAAKPFNLRLDVVPVAGRRLGTASPEHLLVPSALLQEPEQLLTLVRPAVERLA